MKLKTEDGASMVKWGGTVEEMDYGRVEMREEKPKGMIDGEWRLERRTDNARNTLHDNVL